MVPNHTGLQIRYGVCSETKPEDWLLQQVADFEDNDSRDTSVPLKDDGSEYEIDGLYPDQQEIVALVLNKIKEFMECKDMSNFKPLRLIINGAGGSGKSVIINTIVTAIRRMFDSDDVVKVVAPTGTAAFNVHGQTFHHMLGNRVAQSSYIPNTMSKAKKMKLVKKFKTLLALIVDERSLVSNVNIGTAARQIAESIFEGGPLCEESIGGLWGGLPVVILAGDDYQLPSMEEGATKILNYQEAKNKMTALGRRVFLECSEHVMDLKGSKRISDDKQDDKDLIANIRIATEIEVEDRHVKKLMSLRLDRIRALHGNEVVKDIEDKAIYLFYKNEKRIRHNLKMLARHQSPENPVAMMKAKSHNNKFGKGIASHFDSDSPVSSMMCIGAKVALDNKNFCPQWGLHNGACGTVKEIVFQAEGNPNQGCLPKYTVVEFPAYCGPAWDTKNPKVRNSFENTEKNFEKQTPNLPQWNQCIPIPISEYSCNRATGCCRRTYVPLCLAYARTIHKFQGLTAGPVDEGKIPNMFECIICDPDEGKFESSALGLFYTAVSRATTLGDEDGMNSAIYFIGEHMNEERIRRIGMCKGSRNEFVRVNERRKWVRHIERSAKKSNLTKRKANEVLKWATETTYAYNKLADRISKYIFDKTKPKTNRRKRNNNSQT